MHAGMRRDAGGRDRPAASASSPTCNGDPGPALAAMAEPIEGSDFEIMGRRLASPAGTLLAGGRCCSSIDGEQLKVSRSPE